MSSSSRKLKYGLAINEALHQMMAGDESVFLIGQGVKSPWYVGDTASGLLERFGSDRVIDTPVSENAMTGAGVGAALASMRPVVVHPRMDFMMYAFDPIINEAANWYYMNGGKLSVPVVMGHHQSWRRAGCPAFPGASYYIWSYSRTESCYALHTL